MAGDPAFIGINIDHIAHRQPAHVAFDGQGPGVFHGIEEDRRDLAAQTIAAGALVGDERDIIAHVPQHGVGRGLARRAGADHIADIGQRMTFLLQFIDQADGADRAGLVRADAGPRHLQHGLGMQRDVGPGPGVGGRREVVGVGLAGHLEDRDGDLLREFGPGREPLGRRPGLHDPAGVLIARVRLFPHIVEGVKHQQGMRQRPDRGLRQRGLVVQAVDQGLDVIAAEHRAQQFDRLDPVDQRAFDLALAKRGQKAGLHIGGLVNPGRHALADQVQQKRRFPGWRIF